MKLGSIYKLTSSQTDKIYIGSTFYPLDERMKNLLLSYKSFTNGKEKYSSAFEILKFEDCKIELIREVQEIDLRQEATKEMKQHPNVVNSTMTTEYIDKLKMAQQKYKASEKAIIKKSSKLFDEFRKKMAVVIKQEENGRNKILSSSLYSKICNV